MSQETTNVKGLKITNLKDLPTKTYNAERSDQPLQLACNKGCETQGQLGSS